MNEEIVLELLTLAAYGTAAGAAVGAVIAWAAGFKLVKSIITGALVSLGLSVLLLVLWGLALPAH